MPRRGDLRYLTIPATATTEAEKSRLEATKARSPVITSWQGRKRSRTGAELGTRNGDERRNEDVKEPPEPGNEQRMRPDDDDDCAPDSSNEILPPLHPPALSTVALGPTSKDIPPARITATTNSTSLIMSTQVVMSTSVLTSTAVAWSTVWVTVSPTTTVTATANATAVDTSSSLASSSLAQSTPSSIINTAIPEVQTTTSSIIPTSFQQYSSTPTTSTPISSTTSASGSDSAVMEQLTSMPITQIPVSTQSSLSASSVNSTASSTAASTASSSVDRGVGVALGAMAGLSAAVGLVGLAIYFARRWNLIQKLKDDGGSGAAVFKEKKDPPVAALAGFTNQNGRRHSDNEGRSLASPPVAKELNHGHPVYELYVPPSTQNGAGQYFNSEHDSWSDGGDQAQHSYNHHDQVSLSLSQQSWFDDPVVQAEGNLVLPLQISPTTKPLPHPPQSQYSQSRYSNTTLQIAPLDIAATYPQGPSLDNRLGQQEAPLPPFESHWSVSQDSITSMSTVPRFRDISSWATDQRTRVEVEAPAMPRNTYQRSP